MPLPKTRPWGSRAMNAGPASARVSACQNSLHSADAWLGSAYSTTSAADRISMAPSQRATRPASGSQRSGGGRKGEGMRGDY